MLGSFVKYGAFFPCAVRSVLYQLRVKVAASVIGPPIVIEAGLFVPEYEPVPLPLQLVKL